MPSKGLSQVNGSGLWPIHGSGPFQKKDLPPCWYCYLIKRLSKAYYPQTGIYTLDSSKYQWFTPLPHTLEFLNT